MDESSAATSASSQGLLLGTAVFCAVGGALFALFGIVFVQSSLASLGWPVAEGEVETVDVVRRRLSDSRPVVYLYTYTVSYRYEAEGNRYENDRYSLGQGPTASRDYRKRDNAIAAAKEAYSAGQPIQVYYNPKSPGDAVLKPGPNVGTFVPLILAAVLLSSGWGLWKLAQLAVVSES